MKNVFFLFVMIDIICVTPSCRKNCGNAPGYHSIASQLKKYSFKPGSYWVYQDSTSGIIDSESVYFYAAQNDIQIGSIDGYDGSYCAVYGDAFSMSVASFWNGLSHDSIFWGNQKGQTVTTILISYSSDPQRPVYSFLTYVSRYTDSLSNFTVSDQTFSKVYLDQSDYYPLIYRADYIGVVKWVFNDSINGQHTWNLLRYHVINP